MAIQHRDIVDPQQHEPKDISTAAAKQVYRADGVGSGDWEQIDRQSLHTTDIRAFIEESIDAGDILIAERHMVHVTIPNFAVAGVLLVPVPEDMTFTAAQIVIGAATEDGNPSPPGTPGTINFTNAASVALGTAVTVPLVNVFGAILGFTATQPEADLIGPTYVRIAWTPNDVAPVSPATTIPVYIAIGFEIPIPV